MHGRPSILKDRMRSLITLHADLDRDIRDELARPLPDGMRLQTLKRMRLRVKDRIALLTRPPATRRAPQGRFVPQAA